MPVFRIYVEKKPEFAVEAKSCLNDLKTALRVEGVESVRILNRYDAEKLSEEDRLIIQECAAESALYERELWTQREEKSRKEALENGVKEVVLTYEEKQIFQKEMADIYEKYCSDYMDIIDRIIAEGDTEVEK